MRNHMYFHTGDMRTKVNVFARLFVITDLVSGANRESIQIISCLYGM